MATISKCDPNKNVYDYNLPKLFCIKQWWIAQSDNQHLDYTPNGEYTGYLKATIKNKTQKAYLVTTMKLFTGGQHVERWIPKSINIDIQEA